MNRIAHAIVEADDRLVGRPCASCFHTLSTGDVALLVPQKTFLHDGVLALHRGCMADTAGLPFQPGRERVPEHLVARPCPACNRRFKADEVTVVLRQPVRPLVLRLHVVGGECAVHADCMAEAVAAAPVESDETVARHLDHAMAVLVASGDEDYGDYLDGRRPYPPANVNTNGPYPVPA